jgi:hypothetical protein
MPPLTLSRRFDVGAPPERVWAYLTTPELVVTCLPGAALVSSSEDGRRHQGTVTVKLGAMSVSYRGIAEFVEVDDRARRLRLSAKGREKTGTGSAEMTLQAAVVSAEDGCKVDLEASVSVTGKIVTLGRGMIGIVSAQVMSEFVTCLSDRLANGRGAAASGRGDHEVADVSAADASTASTRGTARPGAAAAPATAAGLALLWRALRAWLGRLFGRG